MKKRSVSKTAHSQGNPSSPPDLPPDEPIPTWILSGLYTWRHLESRLFHWDRGTFGERWVRWQETVRYHSYRPSLIDPGRDAFGEELLFDDPTEGPFGSNPRSLNMLFQDRTFRPADRVECFLSDLLLFGWWDSTVALLDFRRPNERIGDLADLELLSLFLKGYFEGPSFDVHSSFFDDDRAEGVFPPCRGRVASASVKRFGNPPWHDLREAPHGLSVPVFDSRKSASDLIHPFLLESCRWPMDPATWASQLINSKPDGFEEIGVREFVNENHDLDFRESGVSRFATVLRPVANRAEQPDSLLRSLIDAIWLSMRETRNRVGSSVSIPEVPTTDTVTADTLQLTAHRLDGWLHKMNLVHPEELQRDWRAMYARCPELIQLRIARDLTGSTVPDAGTTAGASAGSQLSPDEEEVEEKSKSIRPNRWEDLGEGHQNILKAMAKTHDRRMISREIGRLSGYRNDYVRRLLAELRSWGLIDNQKNMPKGYALTPAGLQIISK